MRKLALLSLGVICSSMVSAVTIHFSGTGAGYSPVELRNQPGFQYANFFAGLLRFTVDGVNHQGYCLSPETTVAGSNWQASVSVKFDKVGGLIHKGFEHLNDNIWQAAAQIAIWEELVNLNPLDYQYMANGIGTYDWEGVHINTGTTEGAQIWSVLQSDFGYSGDSSLIKITGSIEPNYYTKYSSETYLDGRRVSQDLGEPGVPAPAAAIPFVLGFLASCRKRRN